MKKVKNFGKIIAFVFLFFSFSYFGIYIYSFITPKISLSSANQLVFFDNENNLMLENIDGNKWIKLDEISKHVINGTIYTEDKHFFNHIGFDYLRIIKALTNNMLKGAFNEGASTISQQYIKNLYLPFDKTWERKIEEAFLTVELEVHYTKNEILEGYLNTINYGAGNYGIENASNYYFGKSSKNLSLAEASLLVGIPKNPSLYNPITNFESSKKRQYVVLSSMYNNKIITKEELTNAYNEVLTLASEHNKESYTNIYYYKDAVLNELYNLNIPTSLIDTGGLKIYTNFDASAQQNLEKSIKKNMKDDQLQVAAIVVEPSNGKIIALSGGKDYNKSEFNRAISAKRQVGSTMKPFLYYAALENGFTPSSTFTSEKTIFNIGNDSTYSPSNYGNVYANKKISLAAAIAYSDNIYAVKTHLFLGEDTLINYSKRAGITTNLNKTASLALGTSEITMLDFASGYITLANEGTHNEPYFINKVTDMHGNVLYKKYLKEEKVFNDKYVYILNQLLTSTYNYDFLDYSTPTLINISGKIKNKYAIKSGSTDTDYWTIGYNKDLLTLVWVGYDDNSMVENYQSTICRNIWLDTSESILKKKKSEWYEIPDGINMSFVNPISGENALGSKGVFMYYLKGSEPNYNFNFIN